MIRIYVIDSCALIDASKHYNLAKKSFQFIWNKISELFNNGELISNIEIFNEIKDDDLKNWLNNYKNHFFISDKNIQDNVTEILNKYPQMIKSTAKSSSSGDPFLVATALKYQKLGKNVIVVTNEKTGDETNNQYKIPNVCKKYNIPCINLNSFINEIID